MARIWLLMLLAVVLGGCLRSASLPRVVVLGLDGCDPILLEQFMAEGHLPNFSRLRARGAMSTLGTSNPPQSPVAWANMVTGLDSGGHGLFDFLHRDPRSLAPITSMSSVVGGKARQERRGQPFWEVLTAAGIPCTLLRAPCHYPAPERGARSLTGLGTPDLLGGYGSYTVYSEGPYRELRGGQFVKLEVSSQNTVEAQLIGPQERGVPMSLALDRSAGQLLIRLDEHRTLLKVGEWSPWINVDFEGVGGIVRFCLASLKPLTLYASPLNVDPARPALPISTPPSYAPHLSRCCGSFYTQAMAEETKALDSGILDDRQYLEQSRIVLAENRALLQQGLKEFDRGLLFFYVSHLDLQSHVFWGNREVLLQAYQDVDQLLGDVLQGLDADTTLWVLSDHGFASFGRVVDLNSWLAEQGYLALAHDSGMESIDWSHTRAYALGFNGVYLNLSGRESQGVVSQGERERLLDELSSKLQALADPKSGQRAVHKVYRSSQLYHGDLQRAPDLVVGYRRDFRVSWESALGGRRSQVFEANRSHWCGDHLIDPSLVPGVLLCSRRFAAGNARLTDLAPTLIRQFDLTPPPEMVGRNLLED